MKQAIPNCVTTLRIIGSAALIFLTPLSPAFYMLYTFCGFSDVVDGWLARSTQTTSELGAKLDSVADLLFYSVMILRILPVLWAILPRAIWLTAGGILLLRVCSYATAAIKYRRFASMHTWLNKLTGLSVFTLPYIILLPIRVPLCWGICVIAALASLEELLIHLSNARYQAGRKSIFQGRARDSA